jgi:predicted SAM-dependent methyltransferase
MRIDLGCGRDKHKGFFGIDAQALPGVDLVCNCEQRIPLSDNCAKEILAINFIEHVHNDKRIHIMNEIWRLLANKGTVHILVPDATAGQGAFMDPTHYSFWCINSFKYYTEDEYRNLYGIKAKFKVLELKKQRIESNDVDYVFAKLEAIKI